jgi:hypothetical protein
MKCLVTQPGRIYDLPTYLLLLHAVAITSADPLVNGNIVILFQGINVTAPHGRSGWWLHPEPFTEIARSN